MSAASDRERFERLATVCGPTVLGYLARRAEPPADAADIYQEVLIVVWRRLRSVPEDDGEALGWMIGVARRSLANHRRGAVRHLAATERLWSTLPGAVEVPESDLDVIDALEALDTKDRELITLVYWDGLSCEQAATAIGISAVTARKRLQRTRDRLRDQLDQATGSEPVAPALHSRCATG
ncbi:MAG TPA: sigma-70 family RNA polymerase sigma factor [Mycobacteriales bacterium]|nr:sigma-70 family RNA polymerase sigma factor [Mycobacteriales bacterium]